MPTTENVSFLRLFSGDEELKIVFVVGVAECHFDENVERLKND